MACQPTIYFIQTLLSQLIFIFLIIWYQFAISLTKYGMCGLLVVETGVSRFWGSGHRFRKLKASQHILLAVWTCLGLLKRVCLSCNATITRHVISAYGWGPAVPYTDTKHGLRNMVKFTFSHGRFISGLSSRINFVAYSRLLLKLRWIKICRYSDHVKKENFK